MSQWILPSNLPGLNQFPKWRERGAALAKAGARVGRSKRRIKSWLLAFAECDLSKMSNAQWQDLAFELEWLAYRDLTRIACTLPDVPECPPSSPTPSEIEYIHQLTKQLIDSILRKQPCELRFRDVGKRLQLATTSDGRSKWCMTTARTHVDTQIVDAIFNVLAACADYLRRCLDCQRTFIGSWTNQDYCSARCQGRSAARRWRERHGLFTGRPRERPRKQQDGNSAKVRPKEGGLRGKKRRQGSRRRRKAEG